eukprot:TRINITY_DN3982_c0_g1_i9.p1 TRINITY_DN3982_c0_g1~~TRINITY_DN3982_c0_g1_i9.p1  ORF type:complete len:786 (-),score=212.88 TRINITY_DN3982_c0_g1_i9:216-2573(-)
MVEICLDAVGGDAFPSDLFLSMRVGESQKFSRASKPSRVFKFPSNAIGDKRFGKLEIYRRIGMCSIGIEADKMPGIHEVSVDVDDTRVLEGAMKYHLQLVAPGGKAAKAPAEPAAAPKENEAVSAKVAVAQEYLQKHQIELRLSDAMQALMHHRPEDPASFLAQRFLRGCGVTKRIDEAGNNTSADAIAKHSPAAEKSVATVADVATDKPAEPPAEAVEKHAEEHLTPPQEAAAERPTEAPDEAVQPPLPEAVTPEPPAGPPAHLPPASTAGEEQDAEPAASPEQAALLLANAKAGLAAGTDEEILSFLKALPPGTLQKLSEGCRMNTSGEVTSFEDSAKAGLASSDAEVAAFLQGLEADTLKKLIEACKTTGAPREAPSMLAAAKAGLAGSVSEEVVGFLLGLEQATVAKLSKVVAQSEAHCLDQAPSMLAAAKAGLADSVSEDVVGFLLGLEQATVAKLSKVVAQSEAHCLDQGDVGPAAPAAAESPGLLQSASAALEGAAEADLIAFLQGLQPATLQRLAKGCQSTVPEPCAAETKARTIGQAVATAIGSSSHTEMVAFLQDLPTAELTRIATVSQSGTSKAEVEADITMEEMKQEVRDVLSKGVGSGKLEEVLSNNTERETGANAAGQAGEAQSPDAGLQRQESCASTQVGLVRQMSAEDEVSTLRHKFKNSLSSAVEDSGKTFQCIQRGKQAHDAAAKLLLLDARGALDASVKAKPASEPEQAAQQPPATPMAEKTAANAVSDAVDAEVAPTAGTEVASIDAATAPQEEQPGDAPAASPQ